MLLWLWTGIVVVIEWIMQIFAKVVVAFLLISVFFVVAGDWKVAREMALHAFHLWLILLIAALILNRVDPRS